MHNKKTELAREIAKECRSMQDVHATLKELFKDSIEEILQAELDEHLGYDKHSVLGNNSGNSRNGTSKKTIKTQFGETSIKVPRDRNGDFEPKVVGKYETTASELEEKVISMYAKGVSTRDIEDHLKDIYGVDISPSLVSKITDKIHPLMIEWQSRPLEKIYPIVFLDAIHFKVRQDHRIVSKAAYTVLGINLEGYKDILGIWVGENESASFWLGVCNDLKSRGVEDILIACKDGLSGFSEAIEAVFPQTDIQLCVVHQIRNSMRFLSSREKKIVMDDLKKIYQALLLKKQNWSLKISRKSGERNIQR